MPLTHEQVNYISILNPPKRFKDTGKHPFRELVMYIEWGMDLGGSLVTVTHDTTTINFYVKEGASVVSQLHSHEFKEIKNFLRVWIDNNI